MSPREPRLRLGSETVKRLLPHRHPLLLVDGVESYERSPRPALTAFKHVSANEPVLAGHFPAFAIWPGCYTIEGLAQSCNLLGVVCALEDAWRARGDDPDDVLEALRNLERGHRGHADFRPERSAGVAAALGGAARGGLLAAVDVRLLEPVFAGERLEYLVSVAQPGETVARFEVEARSGGRPVARGALVVARGGEVARLFAR